jgi:allophanate hydrolase subunit 1
LVTGYLTQTDGDDYAHVYISTVCHYSGGDVVHCGIRDLSDDKYLGIVEVISGANRVTIKLKTKGGRHRAEGVVYEI